MKPKISVIMVVYNEEKFVSQGIKSILNQTFGDFELIVMDDGSEDHTVDRANSFSDKRIRVIANKKHKGAVHCFNQAIEHAKGEYIARMDADDMSMRGRLKKQFEMMENDPELAVTGTGLYFLNYRDGDFRQIIPVCDDKTIRTEMRTHNQINAASTMYRKSALERVGGYDTGDPRAWAYSCHIKLAAFARLGNIPDPEYVYFYRTGKTHQGAHRKFRARNSAMSIMAARTGKMHGGSLKSIVASKAWLVYHRIPRPLQIFMRNVVSKKKNITLTSEKVKMIENAYESLKR